MTDNETKQETAPPDSKQTRERSKIPFPYGDLDGALEVVKAIYNHGGNAATLDQLADWIGHDNVNSGAFRNKIAAAKLFGFSENDRDTVTLTGLGKEVSDPKTEGRARAIAFLNVPLYRKLFDTYKGGPLPSDKDLEGVMKSLGVPEKQTDRARQSFQRSAEQAKVFNDKKDRLVLPAGVSLDSTGPNGGTSRKVETPQISAISTSDLSPMISVLLKSLPPAGSKWSREAREQWMRIFEMTLDNLYKEKAE